jgi:hypothetical protein
VKTETGQNHPCPAFYVTEKKENMLLPYNHMTGKLQEGTDMINLYFNIMG